MSKIKDGIEAFHEFLKDRDLKTTSQRDLIVKEIFLSPHQHFSADELLETVRKKDSSISRATVYRTLSLLLESSMMEELDIGKGHKYYETMFGVSHHDHLICLKCEKIVEFESPEIEALQDEIIKKSGFKSVYHSHKIFGYCSVCKKKEKPK